MKLGHTSWSPAAESGKDFYILPALGTNQTGRFACAFLVHSKYYSETDISGIMEYSKSTRMTSFGAWFISSNNPAIIISFFCSHNTDGITGSGREKGQNGFFFPLQSQFSRLYRMLGFDSEFSI